MPVSQELYFTALILKNTLYPKLRTVFMTDTLMPDDYNVPYQIMKQLLTAVNQQIPIPDRTMSIGDNVYAEHVKDLREICYSLWFYIYYQLQEPYITDPEFGMLKQILDTMRIPKGYSELSSMEWNSIFEFCRRMIDLIIRYRANLWSCFQHNVRRTGYQPKPAEVIYFSLYARHLYALNPDGTEKWRVYISGGDNSSPVIDSEGTIYIGSFNGLYSISPYGFINWNVYPDSTFAECTPAISPDGTIYIGGYGNTEGLFAFDKNGNLLWFRELGGIWESSPAIGSDGTIYVGSDENYINAVNKNGSIKWRIKIEENVIENILASPAIGSDGTIYISSNNLYAINPNGSIKWICNLGGVFYSSPTIGEDGSIYIGSLNGYVFKVSKNGSVIWSCKVGDLVASSPAIGPDGTIYVGTSENFRGRMVAINPNGSIKWTINLQRDNSTFFSSSPAIGSDGTIYIGNHIGEFYAFYPYGAIKWVYECEDAFPINSSPAIG